MTGNGNNVNLLKTHLENLVKSQQVNLFLAGFSYLEPLCDLLGWRDEMQGILCLLISRRNLGPTVQVTKILLGYFFMP